MVRTRSEERFKGPIKASRSLENQAQNELRKQEKEERETHYKEWMKRNDHKEILNEIKPKRKNQ